MVGSTSDPLSGDFVDYVVSAKVTGVQCGTQAIDPEYGDTVTAALGQFCIARIDVTNTAAIPVTFSPSQSSLVDEAGRAFATVFEATYALSSVEGWQVLEELNPTASTSMALVFDVPADVVPRVLHLRDGFGTGVDFAVT